MFPTTSPGKLTEDFLKYRLYVEKIDFEGGPREPKMAKIGTFAENWITFYETSKRVRFFVKIFIFEYTNRK